MSAPYRVRLRTVAARQLWDRRKARGGRGFIPGIRHFQAGVRSLYSARGASDIVAAERLAEVDAALGTVERSLARWRKGLEGFVAESLGSVCVGADRGPVAARIEIDPHPRAGDASAGAADRGLRRGVRGNR